MRRTVLALIAALAVSTVVAARAGGQQGPPPGRAGGPPPVQLPEGAGKDMVSTTCSRCHGLNLITGSFGYTKDGWADRIATMLTLPREQVNTISTYLGEHFPVKHAPGAVLIAGPVQVNIREWTVPTLGSRPHDPLAARDGSIWWTGQFASRLGRVDPRTGALKEFPLPAGVQPHGLVEDRQGNIWYTGINKNVIGRLDPKTGMTTDYPVEKADPMARGPHTPIFDQKGTLWFTLQSGHVGRLNTSTGEMKIAAAPSNKPNAPTYPYGIQVNSQGVPWYVDFRGNRIASVDPNTMAITEITLPDADARPRRIAITPDDAVWWADFARGTIGRYDPKTNNFREWLSPGGKESEPYGIAQVNGVIWYSESGVRPNTMVRFDLQSEKFQTWAVPSGGGVIRNMMADASGNLVIACSGVAKVGVVEVRGAPAATRTN
jgi:virginiamycin B lyase